jgi:sporulation protein YlmC with PRC-barrel domain
MSIDLLNQVARTPLLLTELIHSEVVNPQGARIARLEDVIVRLADGGYPRVSGLKVRIGGRDLFVPEHNVVR